MVRNLPAKAKEMYSILREDPLEKEIETSPVFLPGKSLGQRRLWATVHSISKSLT